MHTSCARIQPLCAILCLAYSRWMAPSELRSSAPWRRAMAVAASDGLAKSTKATGPVLPPPLPPLSNRSRENPGQLYHDCSIVPTRTPTEWQCVLRLCVSCRDSTDVTHVDQVLINYHNLCRYNKFLVAVISVDFDFINVILCN